MGQFAAGEPPRAAITPAGATDTPGRVLVVEDDPLILDLVCDYLTEEGYDAQGASTGEAARAAQGREPFDLVLADTLRAPIHAGRVERWAQVERIRAAAGPTPVVIFTAYRRDEFADYAARGFRDLLVKPVHLDDLRALVARYIPAAP